MEQLAAACACRRRMGCWAGSLLVTLMLAVAAPQAAARTQSEEFPVTPGSGLSYQHVLRYPPRALPARACACRVDPNSRVLPTSCPSPWDSLATTTKIPAPLKISSEGDLIEETTGKRAKLHGINWFGHETGTASMDGLWAYDDDEIPPTSSVSQASLDKLQIKWWGKRTMTNDFAHVVHRIKALGFNAIRVPFNFTNLQLDVPAPKNDPTELYPCVRDPIDYINLDKTLDPKLSGVSRGSLAALAPRYTGMQHPPPARAEDSEGCRRPWEAPFAPAQAVARQYGDKLQLTMCNWYLPQGPHVQQVHRFLWQLQYLVAQGFYVLLDHASYLERDPNMANPGLFAANWGALWRMVTELPGYSQRLRGRIFPDLANEPSRWGCQWERNCLDNQGLLACAPGARLYHGALKAIHNWDSSVPVFINPMGQAGVDAGKFPNCARSYQGMNFGEGTITDKAVLQQTGISDPSVFFKDLPAMSRGKIVLTPHIYPGTLSGWGESTQVASELFPRMDLSYGLKALGKDKTSDGQPLRRLPVVIGEFGAFDHGSSFSQSADFTDIRGVDVTFLKDFGAYLKQKESQGATISWFWWAWNANSGDTKGIAGPDRSWKHMQFTKVRMLTEFYGLRPWYCAAAPSACQFGPAAAAVGKPHPKPAKAAPKPLPKPAPHKPAAAVAKPAAAVAKPAAVQPVGPQLFGGFEQPFVTVLNSIQQAISNVGSIFGAFAVPFAHPVEAGHGNSRRPDARAGAPSAAAVTKPAATTPTQQTHTGANRKAAPAAKAKVAKPKKATTGARAKPRMPAAAVPAPTKSAKPVQHPAFPTAASAAHNPLPVPKHSTTATSAAGKSGTKAPQASPKPSTKKQAHRPTATPAPATAARPAKPLAAHTHAAAAAVPKAAVKQAKKPTNRALLPGATLPVQAKVVPALPVGIPRPKSPKLPTTPGSLAQLPNPIGAAGGGLFGAAGGMLGGLLAGAAGGASTKAPVQLPNLLGGGGAGTGGLFGLPTRRLMQ